MPTIPPIPPKTNIKIRFLQQSKKKLHKTNESFLNLGPRKYIPQHQQNNNKHTNNLQTNKKKLSPNSLMSSQYIQSRYIKFLSKII